MRLLDRATLGLIFVFGGIMAKSNNLAATVETLITPVVTEMGYGLWDVEYVREGAEWYLRVTLDKESGIDIEDCEKVHRAILPMLENYDWDHLEVSSPGAERTLRKPAHFSAVIGQNTEIRLFSPDASGNKSYTGILTSVSDVGVTLKCADSEIVFAFDKIAKAQTIYDFENIK